ncbi:HNH endonuclease signature motif containing protein [Dermatobacter hominis]|uniref:HNH endonuclease signature motif containing protein n=1 Tax=Dermatobacter hominis TaxID=2884263 RepID=UPI001D111298|nr:HNH endonuclease signature motif containing protein [Dermatobacter hominis]UDY35228.1 HNH endonuclease [Dermatobacter hominis]
MRSTGEASERPEDGAGDDGVGDDGAGDDAPAVGGAADGAGAAGVPEAALFRVPAFGVPVPVAAVISALREVTQLDVRGLDDEAVLGLFDGLETVDRLFHSARFAMLAELDARQLCDRRLGHVTANEAGWRHGANPKRVKADLATANTMRKHQPKMAAALARAEVPVDRVREVCRRVNDRNRHALEGAQDALIDLCRQQCTFVQFARHAEQVARLADDDGAEPPMPRDHARIEQSADQVSATIDLYGPAAMAFAQRVEAEADRLWRIHVRDQLAHPDLEVPPRSELLARAFMDLVEHGATHPTSGRTRPTGEFAILLEVDTDELQHLFADGVLLPGKDAGPVDWSQRATDSTGAPLRYATHEWELLTCDAEVTWVIQDAGGHPVACQPGERHANREQRRNLRFRDGRCTFPGCDAPASWCDAHHVTHHADGGATDIRNLALLCRRHHGVIHRTGWSMAANPRPGAGEGLFTITSPSGAVSHSQHRRTPAPA